MGKQANHRATRVFEQTILQRHAERHLRRLGCNAQVLEQRCQVWIGVRIENNEAGIDRNCAATEGHIDRVAMATKTPALLKHCDIMALGEQPACRQSCYPGADDTDPKPGLRRTIHAC